MVHEYYSQSLWDCVTIASGSGEISDLNDDCNCFILSLILLTTLRDHGTWITSNDWTLDMLLMLLESSQLHTDPTIRSQC